MAAKKVISTGETLLADIAEVARLLCVTTRTVHAWHAKRLIPRPLRPSGRLRLWRVAELKDWIAAGGPKRDVWEQIKARGGAASGDPTEGPGSSNDDGV